MPDARRSEAAVKLHSMHAGNAENDLDASRIEAQNSRYRALTDLLAARAPAYAQAQLVVEAEEGLSIAEMARKVAGALAAEPDLFEEEK